MKNLIRLKIADLRFIVRYNRLYPDNSINSRRQLEKSLKRLRRSILKAIKPVFDRLELIINNGTINLK